MARIRIMAMRHSAFYSPLLMTMAGGFLDAEGLHPEYTVATPDNPAQESLRSGAAHLSQSAVATSFAGLEQGAPCDIVHFAQINERDGFFIAARETDPEFAWDHLLGREILVEHHFQPFAMFRYALHLKGLDESRIGMTDAGNAAAIDLAFRAGRGNYVHQQGPFPQQLEREGMAHLVAAVGDVIGPVAFSSLSARREWLETPMAQAFMQAYRRARRFVNEAPPQEIAALEAGFFPGIDRDVLAGTVARYQQLGCWASDPAISREAYEKLLQVFLYNGLISKPHEYGSCVVEPPDGQTGSG